MPVHRDPSGRVYARTAELERWRIGRTKAEGANSPRRIALRVGVGIAVAVLLAVAALLWWMWSPGVPVSVAFDGDRVSAKDVRGRVRWTNTILGSGFWSQWGWEVSSPDRALVADIDRDGRIEVLVNVLNDAGVEQPGRLICFDQDGHPRWEFTYGRAIKDAYGDYPLSYVGHIVRTVRAGGKSYVLTVATQRRWHPSQVALLDPATGKVVEEFWHPGAISHALVIDLNRDGSDELVLGGVNNPGPGHGLPAVMVLRLPFSLVPKMSGSVMAELSAGGPRAYVLIPRSDVLAAQGSIAVVQSLNFEEPDRIVVLARYSTGSSALTYRFDSQLRLLGFFAPIEIAAVHDTLWRAGALNHQFTDSERLALQLVRSYTRVPDANTEHAPSFHGR
jgi:hypothetical protein